MPAEAWHHIRITDDGNEIAVLITGPAISQKQGGQPVLRVRCPDESPRRYVAIYNRELIAEAPQESRNDNVVIRALR